MKRDKFTEWLEEELNKRAWSQGELCRRSGLSSASVSNVLNGQQTPGLKFYQGVAQAFRISLEVVLRQAGLLPPKPEPDSLLSKINYYLNGLPKNEQTRFLIMAKSIWEHYQAQPASVEDAGLPGASQKAQSAEPVILDPLETVVFNLLESTSDDFKQSVIMTIRAWLLYEDARGLEESDLDE